MTPAEKQARYRKHKNAQGLVRQEGWKRPEYMTAAAIAWKALVGYCQEKTEAWNDDEIWKLYQHLLNQAKEYRQDLSGYISIELQNDRKRAKEMNESK
jgi:hypothetical protein